MAEHEESKRQCRYCHKEIPPKASICYLCNRFQNRFRHFFQLEHLVILTSIILVVFSYWQLVQASNEYTAAKEALRKATEAHQKIKEISESFMTITYLKAKTRKQIGDTKELNRAYKIIQDELNRVLGIVFPGSNERKAFIQKIEDMRQEPLNFEEK